MHPALEKTDHRPWSLPDKPWVWRQSWLDLLFAHWPIDTARLRHLVPNELEIDEFDGTSWVGLVPFRMEGVMARGLPDLPGISAFPEMDLRLYVRYEDKPGVLFISLDATNPLAVWGARRFFHLPYFRASMSVSQQGERIHYRSERKHSSVRFRGVYGPTGAVYAARPGTLEHFVTERYCLYTTTPDGVLLRDEIHHRPWPLQRASLEIDVNDVAVLQDIPVHGEPALLHFSKRLDVIGWLPERVC